MPESTKSMVTELRKMLGDYQTTEEDFYVSEEIAEFDPEHMFSYFRGTLDDERCNDIKRFSQESKSFLEDLIGVGELVLGEEKLSSKSPASAWSQIRELATKTVTERVSLLKSSNGIQFELSPAAMLAADSGGVEVKAELDFDATINVYEDNDLVLKIDSDDASLHCNLIGYCISTGLSTKIGYVLLRKGVLDKVSGMVRVDRTSLSGACQLVLETVNYSDLSSADSELLEQAIARDTEDRRSVETWKQWIDVGVSDESEASSKLFKQLRSILD